MASWIEAKVGGIRDFLLLFVHDDHVEIGRFATQILDNLGYRTDQAANADEALECLAASVPGFDVVFSDVVMTGLDDVNLARGIRRRHPDLPEVLTSGYSYVLAEEGQQGFDLVHKPCSAEHLPVPCGAPLRAAGQPSLPAAGPTA